MRDQKEIIKMANTIKHAASELPEFNAFGEDNAELIEDEYEIARQLYAAASNRMDEITFDFIFDWLSNKPSDLDEYCK